MDRRPSSSQRGLTLPRRLRTREDVVRWSEFCAVAADSPGVPIRVLSQRHYEYPTVVDRMIQELKACVENHPREKARQVARLALKRYERAQKRRWGYVPRSALDEMVEVLEPDEGGKDGERE